MVVFSGPESRDCILRKPWCSLSSPTRILGKPVEFHKSTETVEDYTTELTGHAVTSEEHQMDSGRGKTFACFRSATRPRQDVMAKLHEWSQVRVHRSSASSERNFSRGEMNLLREWTPSEESMMLRLKGTLGWSDQQSEGIVRAGQWSY